jgi:hypothetical protein
MYFRKAAGFVLSPGREFRAAGKEKLKEAFNYMLVMLLAYSALSGVVFYLFSWDATGGLVTFLAYYMTGIFANVLLGFWIHIWAYAFGARGVERSLKTVFYGSTPSYLLGWLGTAQGLGVLNFALILWSFGLYWAGLRKLHSLSSAKAAASLAISFVLGFGILLGFAIFTFTALLPLVYSLA